MNQESESKQKRVRWGREQGLLFVREWRRSGESAGAYCRRQGLDPSRLRYWLQVAESAGARRSKATKPISFLPVVVSKASPPPTTQVTPVMMSRGVSPEWAARFVRELFGGEA